MDHPWLAAPGFAIKLWRDAATVGWRANPALLDWGRQRGAPAARARRTSSGIALADSAMNVRPANDYWTKPIDVDQFLAGLDSLAAARQ